MKISGRKVFITLSWTALAILVLSVGVAFAQSTVDWWVVASNGGIVSGGNAAINATLGQPIIGVSTGGNTALGSGYWSGIGSVSPTVIMLRNFTARVGNHPLGTAVGAILLATLILYSRAKRKQNGQFN